jgi:hypothetical protein
MAKVHLPIIGDVPKGWVWAVGIGSVGVVGYVYLRRRQMGGAAAAAGTAAGAGTAADAGTIDPSTGQPYGSAADLSALDGGFGGGFGGGFIGGGTGGQISSGGTLPGPGAFTSNAEWAQYAEEQLSGTVSGPSLSAALGKYLTGGAVTANQHSLIDQAIAIAGYPPVAGPGNHPPAIRNQPSGHSHGKPSTHVKVPSVLGESYSHAQETLGHVGLKARKGNPQVPIVARQIPEAGHEVKRGSTVSLFGPATK